MSKITIYYYEMHINYAVLSLQEDHNYACEHEVHGQMHPIAAADIIIWCYPMTLAISSLAHQLHDIIIYQSPVRTHLTCNGWQFIGFNKPARLG